MSRLKQIAAEEAPKYGLEIQMEEKKPSVFGRSRSKVNDDLKPVT
jgi:hypothetical protein